MEIIDIVNKIRSLDKLGNNKESNILLEKLENGVIDPEISNYIYWSEMSAEQIADKVLNYKPIYL